MAEIERKYVEEMRDKKRAPFDASLIYPVKLNKMMLIMESDKLVQEKTLFELIQGL